MDRDLGPLPTEVWTSSRMETPQPLWDLNQCSVPTAAPHEGAYNSNISYLRPCPHLLPLLISRLNQASILCLPFFILCSSSNNHRDLPVDYILYIRVFPLPGAQTSTLHSQCGLTGAKQWGKIVPWCCAQAKRAHHWHPLLQRISADSFFPLGLPCLLCKAPLASWSQPVLTYRIILYCGTTCKTLHLPSLSLKWLIGISEFLNLPEVPPNGSCALQSVDCSSPTLPNPSLIPAANLLRVHSVLQFRLLIKNILQFCL